MEILTKNWLTYYSKPNKNVELSYIAENYTDLRIFSKLERGNLRKYEMQSTRWMKQKNRGGRKINFHCENVFLQIRANFCYYELWKC